MMSFLNSLLLLLTVSAAICVPLFLGHAISAHSVTWAAIGFAFLLLSAVLIFVNVKYVRGPANH
jgi:hypothetical protein